MMKLSYSAMSTYLQCSLKYYFQYVLRIGIKESSVPMFLGNLVHEMFEQHYKSGCSMQRDEMKELFLNKFDAGIILEDVQQKFPKQIAYSRDIGLRIVDQFFDEPEVSNINLLKYKDEEGEKPAVEMYFRLPVKNLRTGEQLLDDSHKLTGVIDAVENRKGHLKVRDHKTASKEYTDWFIENSLQLTMYAYAIRYKALEGELKTKAKKEHTVGYNIFMKPKDKNYLLIAERKVTDEDLDSFYRTVVRIAEGIRNRVFVPNFGDACEAYGGCEFREICRMYNKNLEPFKDGELVEAQKLLEMFPGKLEIREERK